METLLRPYDWLMEGPIWHWWFATPIILFITVVVLTRVVLGVVPEI